MTKQIDLFGVDIFSSDTPPKGVTTVATTLTNGPLVDVGCPIHGIGCPPSCPVLQATKAAEYALKRRATHRCHARACTKHVPPEMLMCKRHWFRVPKRVRDAVWAHYRPGQCDDMNPSQAWHRAADAAIGFVARAEGHGISKNEADALEAFGL
jgi:hypothetical protein